MRTPKLLDASRIHTTEITPESEDQSSCVRRLTSPQSIPSSAALCAKGNTDLREYKYIYAITRFACLPATPHEGGRSIAS